MFLFTSSRVKTQERKHFRLELDHQKNKCSSLVPQGLPCYCHKYKIKIVTRKQALKEAPEMASVFNSIKPRFSRGKSPPARYHLPPSCSNPSISSHPRLSHPLLRSLILVFHRFTSLFSPLDSSAPIPHPHLFLRDSLPASPLFPVLPFSLSSSLPVTAPPSPPPKLHNSVLPPPFSVFVPLLLHLFKVISVLAVIAPRITHRSKRQHLTKRCSLTLSVVTLGVIEKVHSSSHPIIPADAHTQTQPYTSTVVDTSNLPCSGLPKGQRQLNSS